jgi:Ca2+-binding EF-hand superfamily protein
MMIPILELMGSLPRVVNGWVGEQQRHDVGAKEETVRAAGEYAEQGRQQPQQHKRQEHGAMVAEQQEQQQAQQQEQQQEEETAVYHHVGMDGHGSSGWWASSTRPIGGSDGGDGGDGGDDGVLHLDGSIWTDRATSASAGQTERTWTPSGEGAATLSSVYSSHQSEEYARRRAALRQEALLWDAGRRQALDSARTWASDESERPEVLLWSAPADEKQATILGGKPLPGAWKRHPHGYGHRPVELLSPKMSPEGARWVAAAMSGKAGMAPPAPPPPPPLSSSPLRTTRNGVPYCQLLRPIVESPHNHVYQAVENLKLREGCELDSPPKGNGVLPIGTLVRLVERRCLPNGVERAAVVRLGEREGSLGWITVAREGELRKPKRRGATSSHARRASVAAPEPGMYGSHSNGHLAPGATGLEAASGDMSEQLGGTGRVQSPERSRGARRGAGKRDVLVSSRELEAAALALVMRARGEERQLVEHGQHKGLESRLGEALMAEHASVGEIVSKWATRGVEPITKMQFRQNVRRLVEGSHSKEVDWLFAGLTEDTSSGVEVKAVRRALSKLKETAMRDQQRSVMLNEAASELHDRARRTREVAVATRESEDADARLEGLRTNKTLGARLGAVLKSRNMKVGDLVRGWDPSGNGEVDKSEFRGHVRSLVDDAETAEIDALFESLDEDGGGSLDLDEIRHALKKLLEQSIKADEDIVVLGKTTVDLSRVAKAMQVELRRRQKIDEALAAERRERMEEEARERRRAEREARAERNAQISARRAVADAKREAFEERVNARRQGSARLHRLEKEGIEAIRRGSTGSAEYAAWLAVLAQRGHLAKDPVSPFANRYQPPASRGQSQSDGV